ncbi:hypothetical protein FHETE_4597 [Fusarium heterosporum]|uniref:Uncharacterized protein n=1 Tax=Fusarium heterosporum TaxID=42747 RepID=A0A8H5TDJ0_FUSHE|nr:hypothetical protein FHETE_4597 [Fusarium heterosporum]
MLWRKKLDYDPKEFPNYRILFPEPETGFQRLLKQWPIVPEFVVYTVKFLFNIIVILLQYLSMLLRNPLGYSESSKWVVGQYQASPTVGHMSWGAFITVWFLHLCYRIGFVIWEQACNACDDPLWALYQIWDLGLYSQSLVVRTIFSILSAIFNLAYFSVALLLNMSTYSLSAVIVLLVTVSLYQLHYYFFQYIPERDLTGSHHNEDYLSPERPGRTFRVPTPSTGFSNSSSHNTPDGPGRTFRMLTPSTVSSTSSHGSSPDTSFPPRRPSPRSNKPPGASYVKVSPKAVAELHAEGIFVPESTRVPDYSYLKPVNPKRLTNFHRVDIQIRSRRIKDSEERQKYLSQNPELVREDTTPSTVPPKTLWIYSTLDSIQRQLQFIIQDVTNANVQVNSFRQATRICPLPPTSSSLPGSPRDQKCVATLAEKDRIKAAIKEFSPNIENTINNVLKQQRGIQEKLVSIDRLLEYAGDCVTRAMRGEVQDCKSRLEIMFKGARQAMISSRNIEELCENRIEKLEAEAAKLRRMDRTHIKGIRVSFGDEICQ